IGARRHGPRQRQGKLERAGRGVVHLERAYASDLVRVDLGNVDGHDAPYCCLSSALVEGAGLVPAARRSSTFPSASDQNEDPNDTATAVTSQPIRLWPPFGHFMVL